MGNSSESKNPNAPQDPKRDALLRARNWSSKIHDSESSLAATEDNPALRQLQQQSENFNARVHQALAEIPVPPTLREQILARRIIVRFWRQPQAVYGIAAALALLAAGLFLWMRPPGEDLTFAGFRSRMASFVLREYSMDIHTNQLSAVQSYLAANGVPAQFPLPERLAAMPVKGGASLSWQGHPVGMVCFEWAGQKTLFLFVIDSTQTGRGANPSGNPEMDAFNTLNTGTWSAGGKTFFLAGEIPRAELERLIKS